MLACSISRSNLSVNCATLWVGERLGRIERACLRSVQRQGHNLTLYCYRRPAGVPEGIELRDAADVLPEERVVRHRTGSVALFSNLFRYELQRRALGTWLDCDAYLIAPLDGCTPYLFGEYEPGEINSGVLRLPSESPMLAGLIEPFFERNVPDWLPWRARLAAKWRLRASGRTGIERMPWGYLGPRALTEMARRHRLDHLALRAEVLYPVRWQDADWILRPDVDLNSVITNETISVHLWNERIKHFKEEPAPAGSFLARLQEEGA